MVGRRIVVLKLGGSLLGWPEFGPRLSSYLAACRDVAPLLITGGGQAADFIRELDSAHGIGEKRSHRLALRALDLTAEVVAALVPGLAVVGRPSELGAAWAAGDVPVLSPRWLLENGDRNGPDPLPECWDVTTDSIAARVAVTLGAAELRLLKSTGLAGVGTREAAARGGLVDPYFPRAAAPLACVVFVNLRAAPPTSEALEPAPVSPEPR